jgi:hypothetical protein
MAMKLREILNKSDELGEYDVVYAKRPWSLDTEACIIRYGPDESVPRLLSDSFYEYFLESALIHDIRTQVEDAGNPIAEAMRVILYYAENDAYPPHSQ